MGLDALDELLGSLHAFDALDGLAVFEQYQRRQGLNLVLGSELGIAIAINLHHFEPTLELAVHLLQYRGHHLTGATPSRVKIHQNGDFALSQQVGKTGKLLFSSHWGERQFDTSMLERTPAKTGERSESFNRGMTRLA